MCAVLIEPVVLYVHDNSGGDIGTTGCIHLFLWGLGPRLCYSGTGGPKPIGLVKPSNHCQAAYKGIYR
jgi:hypothetical protein